MRYTMNIVILGLSITSTWGNGHATTYRSLLRAMFNRGHEILFLERDVEWYASHRDMPEPNFCELGLYQNLSELKSRFRRKIRGADLIILGSYIPEGVAVANFVLQNSQSPVVFYDIDTPVTLAKLRSGDLEYLSSELVGRFHLYLSFTGGPLLDQLKTEFGAQLVCPFYCTADSDFYYPQPLRKRWDLGYLGTYSPDRHRSLEELLLTPATRHPKELFIVAGSLYPSGIRWPPNLVRVQHLPSAQHRAFYNSQRFTLNLTRDPMVRAGFSPSVRLFEAAACGATIITDRWRGLETFFEPGKEILTATSGADVSRIIVAMPESQRAQIGEAARQRFFQEHTPQHRAKELEARVTDLLVRSELAA
jgi:spore maturation protein CgeB